MQGSHPDSEQKGKPKSRAASPGPADTTAPATPQQLATSDAEGPVSASVDTPGPANSADGTGNAALPSAAAAAVEAANAWPPFEALSKRVRLLSDLVAQAVAIAESQGLLMPATEAAPGPSYEKQGTKVQSKLMGILPYATTAAAAAAGTLDWTLPGLIPAAAGSAAGAAVALAMAGAKPSAAGSSGALDRLSGSVSGQLEFNEGDIDDLLGDLASPAERFNIEQQFDDGFGQVDEDQYEQESEEEDEPQDQEGLAGPGFGSYFSTGWQARKPGRPRKGTQRGSVADAAAVDLEAGDGRRRAHRPSRRYGDAVLLELDAGDAAFTGASQGESGAHEVTKKARRELLNLVNTWGPPDATGEAADAAAAAAGADPAAAAVAMAAAGADYDWDDWAGAGGLTGPLQKMSQAELTVMLRELLAEMDELASAASAAAAAGLNKARNAHQPNCDCVVCTNRRNADQRKKEAQGGAEAAAEAAAAEAAEAEAAAAAAAAAKAAVKPLPKGEVLTAMTAGRLQERIELVALFRAVAGLAGSGQLEAAFKKGAKDLPNWWTPQLDVGLVVGVVTHGYGNWAQIFEDENLPFKATATAAGVTGFDYDPSDPAAAAALGDAATRTTTAKAKAGLPEWVPDVKVLTKRCKALVAAIKAKIVGDGQKKGGKSAAADEEAAGGSGKGSKSAKKGGKGAGTGPTGSKVAGGMQTLGPGMHMQMGQMDPAAAAAQMQHLAAMGMLPPNMAATAGRGGAVATSSAALQQILAQRFSGAPGATAAAAGNPAMAAALQQRQQQMLLLQQQQQQQNQMAMSGQVLGKRSAAEAGLPESSQPQKAAATATAGEPAVTGGAAPAGRVRRSAGSVIDSASFNAIVAAAEPALSADQIAALQAMPLVERTPTGQPLLPLDISDRMTLLALGKVDPSRPAFHSGGAIYPIGLQTAVQYPSALKAGDETTYRCVVADGAVAGAAGPVFLVVAGDVSGRQWLAQSPQIVWEQVHAQVQQVQQVGLPPVDGVKQFGLSHPVVSMLIQELPGADQCAGFNASESPAPAQMVTAIRQLQKGMTDKLAQQQAQQTTAVQQASAAATAPAAGARSAQQEKQQPNAGGPTAAVQATAQQQQLLRAQLLQQQLARMQHVGQMQQQQPQQQQQLMQMLQQQKLLQQNQLLQQQLAAQQQLQQQQRRISGDGQQHQGLAAAPPAAAAANPAALQQLLLMQQRQQQPAQQQQLSASMPAATSVTPQHAALLQQMAVARAAAQGAAAPSAGAGAWPQQQQQQLTQQQLQQQMLLRQALAGGMQPTQPQQPGGRQ